MLAGERGKEMNAIFWIGTLVGAVVSLIVSIVANLYTPQIRAFLDKRSQLRLSSKKAEELLEYELSKAIFSGVPLAIQKLERRRDHATRMMLYSVMFLLLSVALISLDTAANAKADAMLGHLTYIGLCFMGVCFAAALMISVSISGSVGNLILKASDLDMYEKDIRQKWGEDAI
jgi:hypothetical protein